MTEAVARSKSRPVRNPKDQELSESEDNDSENESDNSKNLYSKKGQYRKPTAREDGIAHKYSTRTRQTAKGNQTVVQGGAKTNVSRQPKPTSAKAPKSSQVAPKKKEPQSYTFKDQKKDLTELTD